MTLCLCHRNQTMMRAISKTPAKSAISFEHVSKSEIPIREANFDCFCRNFWITIEKNAFIKYKFEVNCSNLSFVLTSLFLFAVGVLVALLLALMPQMTRGQALQDEQFRAVKEVWSEFGEIRAVLRDELPRADVVCGCQGCDVPPADCGMRPWIDACGVDDESFCDNDGFITRM
jgi:hypothetical protein